MNIGDITCDPRCQSRVEMNIDVVADYAEAMRSGATFPPITVFHDGQTHWLADGFHRVAAAEQTGIITIAADIRQGGMRDAELHAVSANATHGLRRTSADKRRAVELLLGDSEWAKWSDNEIARRCSVSPSTVGTVRRSLSNKSALTLDDIRQYNLPPDFAKVTDSRHAKFVAKHGDISVELDALPGRILRSQLVTEVESLMDLDALRETERLQGNDDDRLRRLFDDLDAA